MNEIVAEYVAQWCSKEHLFQAVKKRRIPDLVEDTSANCKGTELTHEYTRVEYLQS